MTRPLSLRTTLLAGLAVLNLAVVAGIVATVYARGRTEAHAALAADLEFRARTLANALEIGSDGLEFEASEKTLPTFYAPASGDYAVVYDHTGKAIVRSPSLGREPLAAFGEWREGAHASRDLESGPHGTPCAAVTYSFLVHVEEPSAEAPQWRPPAEEERRCQIVVAGDARPRDAQLAALLWFLVAMGAAALAVTVLGGLVVARFVLRPVRRMTEEAARLTPQDTSRRLEPATVVRELGSLSATLNSALDRLGDALDRQRRFTSDASHELRTPLAVLRGNVDLLLRRERTGDEYRAGLERQRRIAQRMTEITENLLALARADDGRAQLHRTRVPMAELARGVCDEFEPIAVEDGVSLRCEADARVEVDGDPMYLGGLVQNLVSNAVKFTPAGGEVTVGLARDDGHAVLDVADRGPGIPPEARARIFERFFRVQDGRGRNEGAGLGLAIVDWIVRAHGGAIQVLDRDGGGTVLRVRLPLAPG